MLFPSKTSNTLYDSFRSKYFYTLGMLWVKPYIIVCIGVLIPPLQKQHPLLFLAKPPLNWQTVQAPSPFLGNPLLYICFRETPSKSRIFQ